MIITKGLLIYYIIYILLFTFYIMLVIRNTNITDKERKKIKNFCIIYFIVNFLFVAVLPLEHSNVPSHIYSYGMAVDFLFVSYIPPHYFFLLYKTSFYSSFPSKA